MHNEQGEHGMRVLSEPLKGGVEKGGRSPQPTTPRPPTPPGATAPGEVKKSGFLNAANRSPNTPD